MKSFILGLVFVASTTMAAEPAPSAKMLADAEVANASCAEDAKKAGCPDAKVGKGLFKCIQQYKKAHPEFHASEACKSATKLLRANKKK